MTKDEAIQEVVDAAQEALKNLIDTGVYVPDVESDDNSYRRGENDNPSEPVT